MPPSGVGGAASVGRSPGLRGSEVRASRVEALGFVNENYIMYKCNLTWFTLQFNLNYFAIQFDLQ